MGYVYLSGQTRLPSVASKIQALVKKKRVDCNVVSARLGIDIKIEVAILHRNHTKKEHEKYAFPRGPTPPCK